MAATQNPSAVAATAAVAPALLVDEKLAEETRESDKSASSFSASAISARTLALHLLRFCKCVRCQQPVREPVTLPCGHSSCLTCIMQESSSVLQDLSHATHRPPRLPLSTTTVPCPLPGCARNAIGRGLGAWAGQQAVYGGQHVGQDDELNEKVARESQGTAFSGAGQLPLDGFVAPTNESSNGLRIISAQSRSSFASRYAISTFGAQGKTIADEKSTLRCDVTLKKTVDLLRRIAGVPPSWPLSDDRQHDMFGRASASVRIGSNSRQHHTDRTHRRFVRPGSSSGAPHMIVDTTTHHRPGSRTEIDERFLGVMGASEAGVESCTVGGVSAVLSEASDDDEGSLDGTEYSEDEDALGYQPPKVVSRRSDSDDAPSNGDAVGGGDDEVGGAYARADTVPRRREKRIRRHTLQQQNLYSTETKSAYRVSNRADIVMASMSLEETIAQANLNDQLSAAATTSQERQQEVDRLHEETIDNLECQLCYMLLIQPLTAPCGHTYCRRCFARSLDHSSSCPLCRTEMPPFSFFQEHASNRIMSKLLTAEIIEAKDGEGAVGDNIWRLKNLYDERKKAIEKEERESLLSTPLFVCTLGFPNMPTILHIFEPRYRLMIRRCLESGHPRFGMVMHSQDMSSPTPGMSPYGTMLEITTVKMLPDGRSMIETMGSYRFKVLQRGSLDGYVVGQIERIDDVPLEAEYELEQASIGDFSLWEPTAIRRSRSSNSGSGEDSVDSSSGGADSSLSPDDDSSSGGGRGRGSQGSSAPYVRHPHLNAAEAREAYSAFQSALGLDSMMRNAAPAANPQPTVPPSFVQRSTAELIDACSTFIESMRSGSAPWLMTRLNDTYGPMPSLADAAAFGYWVALVMPIDEHEKAKLLPIRSARLRLCIVVHWIEQLRQTWWFNHGCSVQ